MKSDNKLLDTNSKKFSYLLDYQTIKVLKIFKKIKKNKKNMLDTYIFQKRKKIY